MTQLSIFTQPDAWNGGSYELAIDLGAVDDAKLMKALTAIWSHPDVDGCYLLGDQEPAEQARVAPGPGPGIDTRLLGVASLEGMAPVACSTVVVREDGGSDWLYFGLSLGSLSTALPVGAFPFDDGSELTWRPFVDRWLRHIAECLFTSLRFRLGLVGWTDGLDGSTDHVLENGVPAERWIGYLLPNDTSVTWYAPNQGAPMRVGRR